MSLKEILLAQIEKFSARMERLGKTFDEIFDLVRIDLYGGMPCRYSIDEETETAHVCQMRISIGLKWVRLGGRRMFTELTIHEFGHPYLAPGSITEHVRYAKLTADKIKKDVTRPAVASFVNSVLNIVYDIVVDTENQDKRKGDLEFQVLCLYEGREAILAKDYMTDEGRINGLLLSYSEAVVGNPFTGAKFHPDTEKAAHAAVREARSSQTLSKSVSAILDHILPFFTQEEDKDEDQQGDGQPGPGGKGGKDGKKGKGKGKGKPQLTDEDLAELSRQIKQAMKDAKKGQSPVAENMAEDPEAAILAAIDKNDPAALAIAGDMMGYGPELMEKALCKAKARDILQKMALKGKTPGAPNGNNVGYVGWSPSMPVDKLNVQASVMSGGTIIIPGFTTKQNLVYQTPGVEKADRLERLAISVDVSGSMSKDDTILAIYALLLWAGKHGMKSLVNIWSNSERLYDWSYDTNRCLDRIWDEYGETGGGTTASGFKKLDGKLKKGDVLFYVTDFATSESAKKHAIQQMSALKASGVKVIFIAMFTDAVAKESGHPFIFCQSIQQLPGLCLSIMEQVNKDKA